MASQPRTRVGANIKSTPRRINQSDPALTTFFILMALASLLIVPAAVLILVIALGWQFLLVLGAAFGLFVAILWLRNWIAERRARSN